MHKVFVMKKEYKKQIDRLLQDENLTLHQIRKKIDYKLSGYTISYYLKKSDHIEVKTFTKKLPSYAVWGRIRKEARIG